MKEIIKINFLPVIIIHLVFFAIILICKYLFIDYLNYIIGAKLIVSLFVVPFALILVNDEYARRYGIRDFIPNIFIMIFAIFLNMLMSYFNWTIGTNELLNPDNIIIVMMAWEIIVGTVVVSAIGFFIQIISSKKMI
ncbi:MAG: hypothetical protein N2749_05975 [Clostridia bacterium]|nr:hypothetical protein [Clostridia bacterium]